MFGHLKRNPDCVLFETNHFKSKTEAATTRKDVHHVPVPCESLFNKIWVSEAVTHVIASVVEGKKNNVKDVKKERIKQDEQTFHLST